MQTKTNDTDTNTDTNTDRDRDKDTHTDRHRNNIQEAERPMKISSERLKPRLKLAETRYRG